MCLWLIEDDASTGTWRLRKVLGKGRAVPVSHINPIPTGTEGPFTEKLLCTARPEAQVSIFLYFSNLKDIAHFDSSTQRLKRFEPQNCDSMC